MFGGVGQSYIAAAHIPTESTPPPTPIIPHPPIPMTLEITVDRETEVKKRVSQSYIAENTSPAPIIPHPPIPMTIEKTVGGAPEVIERKHIFPPSDRRTNRDNETLPSPPGSLPGGGLLSYDVARTFLEIEGGISEVILDSAASHSIISLEYFKKLQQSVDSNLKINKFPQSNTMSVQGVHGDSLPPLGFTTVRVGIDNFHTPYNVLCLIYEHFPEEILLGLNFLKRNQTCKGKTGLRNRHVHI